MKNTRRNFNHLRLAIAQGNISILPILQYYQNKASLNYKKLISLKSMHKQIIHGFRLNLNQHRLVTKQLKIQN
ncbi:MAG: hypothetical protein BRC47_13365 [Cyanobacteria bacterium QS_7_48_42]|nr:MAG: hypothetical protein BRC53_13930 [Cyanobacteria bacterium SW_6_48_11]PSP00221.1 MAG: hypothetical protein BRC47_13365 [Cyanobacteria bacterium QS_7_48_42]